MAGLLLLLLVLPASAVDRITLHLGQVSGSGWRAESVTLDIGWQTESGAAFLFSADRITHPALPFSLEALTVACSLGEVSDKRIHCQKGLLQFNHPTLERSGIPVSFSWENESRTLDLELRELRFAGGVLAIQTHAGPGGWKVNAKGRGLNIQKAVTQLAAYLPPEGEMELTGRTDFAVLATGVGGEATALRWQMDFRKVAFSDTGAEYLGEGLGGHWQGALHAVAGRWQGDSQLSLREGALLSPFVYLEPAGKPVSIDARLSLDRQQQRQRLQVLSLDYQHPDVLAFGLKATIAFAPGPTVEQLHLQTLPFDVQTLYASYIQPTQAESLLANLEWAGRAELALEYLPEGPQRLELRLHDLYVDEAPPPAGENGNAWRRRFGLYGMNGELIWTRGREAEQSAISWEGGHLLEGITLGPARLELQLEGDRARLAAPANIPLLDGSFQVNHFDLSLAEAGSRLAFDGALAPVSMEAFSQAMGWPSLKGKLSGGIPEALYENGVLRVKGAIVINAFDGWAVIRNLRLKDLFGIWPTLDTDLEIKALDLESLTGAFSFGKITGRLDGRIDDLHLENWSPVSFDARFYSPEDDRSRHRISQRAVDNISNLGGGGVSGALSRSFLRFFNEFGYNRLGISCRLKNGVCTMGGVEPAKRGYYLVKGGGIPRIDIIGFNRQIDWGLLVNKLREITRPGAGVPVIE